MISLQALHHFETFTAEFKIFQGKSIDERISAHFKNSYHFARYCQERLPGKHWGQAITDLPMDIPDARLTYFAVVYYLYPIDIRINQDHPKDCLVIFSKDNPKHFVPKDYQALDFYDKMGLLAIKKR